jgi:hypothetical protein
MLTVHDLMQRSRRWILVTSLVETKPDRKALDGGKASDDTKARPFINDDDCPADPDWITNPSQAEGKGFDGKFNCAFHRWAYQNFLWLVSTDPSTKRDYDPNSFLEVASLFGDATETSDDVVPWPNTVPPGAS